MGQKLTTPVFRASYCNLFEPRVDDNGSWKYGLVMIFPPEVVNDPLFIAMQEAIKTTANEFWKGKPPKTGYRTPIRRGEWKTNEYQQGFDLDKNPEYEGMIIVSANAATKQFADGSFDVSRKPGIVGPNPKEIFIADSSNIYSGMYARATIDAFGYSVRGNDGVAFGLKNVQKCYDGPPLGINNTPAENDFESFVTPQQEGYHDDMLGV